MKLSPFRARFRPHLIELLECRCLLTDIFWNNPAGGNFEEPANWNPMQVPGPGDNAFITLGGMYVINLGANRTIDNLALGGPDNSPTLAIRGGALQLNQGARIAQNAVLDLDGGDVQSLGTFETAGFVRIDQGQSLTIAGSATTYEQFGGNTLFTGGQLFAPNVNIQAGLLSGDGQIDGQVTNAGIVAPGQAAGQLFINGDYMQAPAGVLAIEIGGPQPGGQFDQLIIGGSAALDGTLNVRLINQFLPNIGSGFQVVRFANAIGAFAAFTGDSTRFNVMQSAMDVQLVSVAITVNSTADPGNGVCDANECTLREAIDVANGAAGLDPIVFNIPGAGPHTISPTTALPNITSPVIIDGYSQPGAMANTNAVGQGLNTVLMIELNGALAGSFSDGLHITAGGAASTIRGLAINAFEGFGIFVAAGSTGNRIEGNFIGTNVTGTAARANNEDGVFVQGDGNTIGGTASGATNVISANRAGIAIFFAMQNVVQGNFIGTDRSGAIGLGNADGVALFQASDNTIGGTASGAGNVISANQFQGVLIVDPVSTRNVVQGNRIGTDVTGSTALGNVLDGVFVNNSPGNTIGGTTAGAGNVISGNLSDGVEIFNAAATSNLVQGNLIGTDAAGLVELPNAVAGVNIDGAAANTIGGVAAGARNVISGNNLFGILLAAGADNTRIQGNLIGVDATGNAELGNGSHGILINAGANNATIGGTAAGAGNVISFNGVFSGSGGADGINASGDGHLISGNFIGTNATASIALGNTDNGITLNGNNSTVGGTVAGARNVIANNARNGIVVIGVNNAILGNSMFANPIQGIDLNSDGFPPNDAGDADAGANNSQNWPEISGAELSGGMLTITYRVDSTTVNSAYPLRIEFFLPDNSGVGNPQAMLQGETFLGFDRYDAAEVGSFAMVTFVPAAAVVLDDRIVATATDAAGNTSEFSLDAFVQAAGCRLVVNTTADSNVPMDAETSLREAITCANDTAGIDTISFNIPGTGPHSIQPTSALPNITDPVVINGYSQPGSMANTNPVGQGLNTVLMIELNGALAGAAADGLRLAAGSGGSTIRGLAINGFGGDGIEIAVGSNGNLLEGFFVGTNPVGLAAAPNLDSGVLVLGDGNTIGGASAAARSLISGNGDASTNFNGVRLEFADNNVVQGNIIGLDRTGTNVIANQGNGISDISGANNTFGGTVAGAGNLIAGNVLNGIVVQDLAGATTATGTRTLVAGNRIGTDVTGTLDRGNGFAGVLLVDVTNVTVGGTAAGAANLLSGNETFGVRLAREADNNFVQGNLIGTDATGTRAIGNAMHGIMIEDASRNNRVGGTAAGARNVISGNLDVGIRIQDAASTGNLVQGNFVGVDATGGAALGNAGDGISISGAPNTTIGGTTAAARNVISASGNHGVAVSGAGATGTLIIGNVIGTDVTGTIDLGNANDGVNSGGGPTGTTVGGPNPGEGNVISGNQNDGVEFQSGSNTLVGNFIGVNAAGTAALGNAMHGMNINDQSLANTIGGAAAGAGNVISGNGQSGIFILGANSSSNVIQGNRVGTNASGTAALGNGGVGVFTISGNNVIGGTAAGARNVISGNHSAGVLISGAAATSNLVAGNLIGTDAAGTSALGNTADGVLINGGATANTVGGTTAGAGNVISGNNLGVRISDANTMGNTLLGNLLGTDLSGTAPLGNTFEGLLIVNSSGNTIGGTTAGAGNLISGNMFEGLRILGNLAANNVVQGNLVGTDLTGTADLGNALSGVVVQDAPNNTIGGTAAGSRNVVSGNATFGVVLTGAASTGNLVQGNQVGTDVTGTVALGNDQFGVLINLAASNNTIGGLSVAARNLISGNGGFGLAIDAAQNNRVQGNFIGTNAAGNGALGNTLDGVAIRLGAARNTIGGATAGAGNLISANARNGIQIIDPGSDANVVQGNRIGTDAAGGPLGNAMNGLSVLLGLGDGSFVDQNTIAFNGAEGVRLTGGTSNRISRNAIFSNGGLGIDLGGDGVTPNDASDLDAGPNNLQNFPVLDLVFTGGGMTTVRGRLNSTPNTQFRLQFFGNSACDPSGNGEGESFAGEVDAMTDAAGDAVFSATFLAGPAADVITATATDPAGNTSEFSACSGVVPAIELGVMKQDAPDPVQPGANLTYTITVFNNGPNSATGVRLTDALPANVAFVSATPAAAMCNEGSGVVTCNIGSLAAGAQSVVTITVAVAPGLADGTILRTTATVAGNEVELGGGNNTVTIDTTVLAAQGIELVNFTTGALDTLAITYRILGAASPAFDIGIFASADARFDGTDAEHGPRIQVNDPALLAPGEHLLQVSGIPYEAALLDPDVNFVVAQADVNNLVPETDETNNDINFRGIYHRPQSPDPLVVRGNDAGSRYAGGDADTVTIAGAAPFIGITLGFVPGGFNVNAADVSVIRVLALSGDDQIRALNLATPLVVRAGAGNDTMSGGNANDNFNGGPGVDQIDLSNEPTGVTVDLSGGTARGRNRGRDVLAAIEDVLATESRDTILGDAMANRIFGLGGNDAIRGGGGDDLIDAGAGDDVVFGDDANDNIAGGNGNDQLTGNDGDDFLNGGAGNDRCNGCAGNDFILGALGIDILCGDDGNDNLDGGDERDSVFGGLGADNLRGGRGFNTLVVDRFDLFDLGPDGGRVRRI